MRITALDEYGLRCLVTLAKEGPESQLSIAEIAEKEGLSTPYASKLLAILRKAKLVKAVRGRGGGFRIAREPEQINLLEVITALGGPLIDPDHCNKYSGQLDKCIHTDNCSVQYTLAGLARLVGEFLTKTTLADILNNTGINEVTSITSRVAMTQKELTERLNRALNPEAEPMEIEK